MTIIDHAAGLPGRAAGALQGAADAALGVRHQAASDDLSSHPREREEAARERWHAGQPARNAFERDTYAVLENNAAAGMNRLERQGRRAAATEAARTKEAEQGGRILSTRLAELLEAADQADDDLRAVGGIPEVLRRPDAEDEAYARWEAAYEALTAARREAQMEAGT